LSQAICVTCPRWRSKPEPMRKPNMLSGSRRRLLPGKKSSKLLAVAAAQPGARRRRRSHRALRQPVCGSACRPRPKLGGGFAGEPRSALDRLISSHSNGPLGTPPAASSPARPSSRGAARPDADAVNQWASAWRGER
jgi:hypothetical protein